MLVTLNSRAPITSSKYIREEKQYSGHYSTAPEVSDIRLSTRLNKCLFRVNYAIGK
jgi:hypothetical protein